MRASMGLVLSAILLIAGLSFIPSSPAQAATSLQSDIEFSHFGLIAGHHRVTALVDVKTIMYPQSLIADLEIFKRVLKKWKLEKHRRFTDLNLAPPGGTTTWTTFTYCSFGFWKGVLSIYGFTSQGQLQSGTIVTKRYFFHHRNCRHKG